MNTRNRRSFQWFLLLAASLLESACILETIGGPAASPQFIVVTATRDNGS